MSNYVNLIKLSVGTESIDSLAQWHTNPAAQTKDGFPRHVTRMWPKRETEILNGGSIYWVIKGFVQARQRIIRFDEVIGDDGIRRCAIVLDHELIRTTSAQRRPFQGWRYLTADDSPADLAQSRSDDDELPEELQQSLADIGLL